MICNILTPKIIRNTANYPTFSGRNNPDKSRSEFRTNVLADNSEHTISVERNKYNQILNVVNQVYRNGDLVQKRINTRRYYDNGMLKKETFVYQDFRNNRENVEIYEYNSNSDLKSSREFMRTLY